MRTPRARGVLVASATVLLLGACTSDPAELDEVRATPTAGPSDDVSAEPSEEASSAEPTPSPSPSASVVAPPPSPSPDPGEAPASSPEPSPSATSFDEQDALRAAAARRAERDECGEGGIADDFHHVVAEREDALLVFVACFVGAYQANGELLAYDGRLRTWPVEQWGDGDVIETPLVVGDVYEAPDGTIEHLESYRGLGDCGLFQRWEVVGRRLVLAEAREQQCDDGSPPAAPFEWPLVHGG